MEKQLDRCGWTWSVTQVSAAVSAFPAARSILLKGRAVVGLIGRGTLCVSGTFSEAQICRVSFRSSGDPHELCSLTAQSSMKKHLLQSQEV